MSRRALCKGLAIGAVLYFSLATAQSTVFFEPSCVLNCVGYTDCGFNSPKCMCKAAQGNLLNQVLDCMSVHCSPDELASADEAFLDAMQILCSGIDHPIPAAAITSAQGVASSLLSKATEPAAAPTVTTGQSPQPTTTDGPAPTGGSASSPASETDSPTTSGQSSETTSDSSPQTTVTAASSTAAQLSTSTTAAVNHDPTDSTPFATPNAAAPRRAAPYVLVAVPFAAWLAV